MNYFYTGPRLPYVWPTHKLRAGHLATIINDALHVYGMATAANSEKQVKIIVIGGTGSGKSSLVDKLCRGENRAPVVHEEAPTGREERILIQSRPDHARSRLRRWFRRRQPADVYTQNTEDEGCTAKVPPNECMIKNESVIVFDSRVGIHDPEVASVAKTCNVVLVCQKLFEGVYIDNFLKALGSEVLKRTIFVFTFGDEYIKTLYQNLDKMNMTKAKVRLVRKEKEVMANIKEILKAKGIEKEIADDIPSIITSAVEDSLPTTTGDSWVDELWELCKQRRVMKLPKINMKILVVGHTRIGKSSFINKIVGQKVTTVQGGVNPCKHDLIEPIKCTVHGVPVIIYDSRGFSDPAINDRNIIDTAISTTKTADVVLICHRLYGTLDVPATKMLNHLAEILGNELMKHTIFVFTHGDDYKTNCDDEDKKQHMEKQENHFKEELKKILRSCNIENDIIDGIPSIITCGKHMSLPTSDNWVEDFWFLCEERCTPEAVEFVGWVRRNMTAVAAGAGGAIGGVAGGLAVGAVGGALVGTGVIPVPVVGTAVGAVVGAVGGAVVGGIIVGGGGVAAAGGGAKLVKK